MSSIVLAGLLLTACHTTSSQLPPIPAIAGGERVIPCRTIRYAAPDGLTFAAPEPGEVETAANDFDTPETIRLNRRANAVIDTNCGG